MSTRLQTKKTDTFLSPEGLDPYDVRVEVDADGPHFLYSEEGRQVRVRLDFSDRKKIGVRADLLARAIGWKRNRPQIVLDLTCGLARDAAHMARLGVHVVAIERAPQLCEVVGEQLERQKIGCFMGAAHTGSTDRDVIVSPLLKHFQSLAHTKGKAGVFLFQSSAIEVLHTLQLNQITVDTVYYDPMFPESKKSAKSGKDSTLLKMLARVALPEEEVEIVQAAIKTARERVVVKRPKRAPALLAKIKGQYVGQAIRYDIY